MVVVLNEHHVCLVDSTLAPRAMNADLLGFLRRLLRQKHRVNVRQHPAARDGHRAQKLGQLLIVADRQLHVSRNNSALLVISARVPRQFQDFRAQVFEHGGQIHRRAGADARGVLARFQVARDAPDGELKPRLGASARRFLRR